MAGPSWLAAAFAAVMIITAIYCASRLAASRLWRRATAVDADAVHVVMGAAMAGMLLPRLNPLPDRSWEAVFGVAAAWFAVQAIRNLRGHATGGWRSPHPVPHLVESAAMIYMAMAVPGRLPGGPGQRMPMPGMGGGYTGAAGSFQVLAVVLALFMAGYVLWTADQLTSRARATTAAPTRGAALHPAKIPITTGAPAAAGTPQAAAPPNAASTGHADPAGSPPLAPQLAACYKIAMGITMGYMLIMML
jgi:hypothetical protein